MISCSRCGFQTMVLCNLKSHFNRKNVCEAKIEDIDIKILYNDFFEKELEEKTKDYKCSFCNKSYIFSSSKYRHEKTCPKKIENELLQKELEEKQKEIDDLKLTISTASTINTHSHNQTNSHNQTTNNTNNSNSHNNITNNITINSFGNENLDFLTNDPNYNKIMLKCLKNKEQGILQLIKLIYFNEEHPENQTIKKHNKKDKFLKMYDGEDWKTGFVKSGIFTILTKIEAEFGSFLESMEEEDNRVKDPIMKRFMNSVGHALNFDFSFLENPPENSQFDEKKLEKMKNDLYELFVFFINEKTRDLIASSENNLIKI